MEKSRLHVYTGDGKGKTTAAMGLALRALGHEQSVLIAQFLKDGQSGELSAIAQLPGVQIYPIQPMKGFVFLMSDEEKWETAIIQNGEARKLTRQILEKKPKMIVLDELCVALSTGMVDEETAGALLDAALSCGETVVTGRGAPEWLVKRADYVSCIKAVKHPYQTEKLSARAGVEW